MFTLLELANLVDGDVEGDGDIQITGVSDIEHASDGEISFIASAKQGERYLSTKASAVIVPRSMTDNDFPVIYVDDPYLAFAVIHNKFLDKPFAAQGVHSTVTLGQNCDIHENVTIGPQVAIGNNVKIAENVAIHPGVVIEDNVEIDAGCQIRANCSIGHGCKLGRQVILHSGVVIGSDGFGFATTKLGQHIKRPQVGNVVIEDNVEIGANSCVDRATFGTTRIKQGTKIDNLVQVGHNVVIGENSIIVSQAGIAGSSSLGRNVVLGGQVGVSGHIHLADQVMVGAKSGVHNNVPEKSIISGYPAIAHKMWLRTSAIIHKLPELVKDVRKLKKDVASLLGATQK